MIPIWKQPHKSVSKTFDHLTPEKEITNSQLIGNLKDIYKFIIPDIYIDKNSIILDIGANVGNISSVFSRYSCQVHSFEPTKTTFDILNNRFRLKDNVTCYNKACGTKNELVKLYHHELSNYNEIFWSDGNSLLPSKTNVNIDDYELVECIDLSEFIFNITKNRCVDFVKMDIEGAEIEVINHLIDTDAINNINYLICEIHDKKNKFLEESTKVLKQRVKSNGLERKIFFNWI